MSCSKIARAAAGQRIGFDEMVRSGISNRLNQLEAVADRVIKDMDYAAALHANLERMADPHLERAFGNTPHVKALNVVYRALLEQLVLVLMRMYDAHDEHNQRTKDRASLRGLQNLLKDQQVQAHLIAEAARKWPAPVGIERTKETARKHLINIIESVQNVRAQALFKAWLDYRNIFIGHSLVKEIEQAPIYGEAEMILHKTLEIGDSLRLVVRHESRDWRQALRAREGEAACFWDAVLRGMRAPWSDPQI